MRRHPPLAAAGLVAALLVWAPSLAAGGKSEFSAPMPKERSAVHALDRLAFGPRPGEAAQVRKHGVKKWIAGQLHPERIRENPALEERLRLLDTLGMTPAELVRNYPPPQVVSLMAAGKAPYPEDPLRRAIVRRYVEGLSGKPAAAADVIARLLTPGQAGVLERGTPRQKAELVEALPPAVRDELLAAMPPRLLQILPLASPALRRTMLMLRFPQQVIAEDLAAAKLYRAIYSNRQLQEVLSDFWFNHFNVYLDKGADRFLVTSYERDAIRPHVLGKFYDLLLATARSPAMLFYLDNWQSVGPGVGRGGPARRGLNENYGRELLELHTLGVDGGYTQKDVTEVARCFTGWTIREPRTGGGFEFNPRLHDDGEKIVLGVRIPAGGGEHDGIRVLEMLARHPSTAHFISRKLAQRFVADDPPAPLVDRLAAEWRKTDGDVRRVLEVLFRSREFWSRGAWRAKVKSPLEVVASAVRRSGADVEFTSGLVNQVAQLGQPLYRKQEPTGYGNAGREWANTAGLMGRLNFAVALAANRVPGVKVEPGLAVAAELGGPDFQRK